MKKTAILVVDDKQANLAKAENQFNGKNVALTCCNVFSVASEMLKNRKFDILLTDLMMPGEAEGVGATSSDIGKDVPYGLVLSILAKNMGVAHVAILTDISHHASPIAWAMDNLLGTHPFVSGFNQSDKNWLKAAEGFMAIEDASPSEQAESSTKKSFMLIGRNDTYKKTLEDSLKAEFDVIFITDNDTRTATLIFAEQNPDFTLVIGEINGQASKDKDKKDIFEKLLLMKKPEQKVLAAGWTKSDNSHYLRLPFAVKDLLEKMEA